MIAVEQGTSNSIHIQSMLQVAKVATIDHHSIAMLNMQRHFATNLNQSLEV